MNYIKGQKWICECGNHNNEDKCLRCEKLNPEAGPRCPKCGVPVHIDTGIPAGYMGTRLFNTVITHDVENCMGVP